MEKVLRKLSVIIVLLLVIAMCGSFLVLGNQEKPDTSNNDDVQLNEQRPVDWSTLHISCLGDSITKGAYLDYSYPACLKNELGAKEVDNYGISGNTLARNHSNYTTAMCVRYTEIDVDSDIIIVMGGVNDRGSIPLGTIDDTDVTTFYGALNTLCSGLKENYPNAWVFFMTNFKYADCDTLNTFEVEYKNYYCLATQAVCSKYGIDVFDTYNKLKFDTATDTTDSVHPKQSFVGNKWVPAIARYIKINYPGKAA